MLKSLFMMCRNAGDLSISARRLLIALIISLLGFQNSQAAQQSGLSSNNNRQLPNRRSVPISVVLNDLLGGPEVDTINKWPEELALVSAGRKVDLPGRPLMALADKSVGGGEKVSEFEEDEDIDVVEPDARSRLVVEKLLRNGKQESHLEAAKDEPRIIKGILAGFIGRRR